MGNPAVHFRREGLQDVHPAVRGVIAGVLAATIIRDPAFRPSGFYSLSISSISKKLSHSTGRFSAVISLRAASSPDSSKPFSAKRLLRP